MGFGKLGLNITSGVLQGFKKQYTYVTNYMLNFYIEIWELSHRVGTGVAKYLVGQELGLLSDPH